jgi:uncharacterized protein YbaA (DUF1428 family)
MSMTYFQGFVIPVPQENKEAYRTMAKEAAPFFTEYGSGRIVEGWGEDVPRGKTTDLYGAVSAEGDENVVFSWIEWDSEAICQQAHDAMMKDERMKMPPEMPFDGKRMVFAGFDILGESGDGGETGYFQGYVAPAPKENRSAFADLCAMMREVAIDSGALRAVDAWADDIADGEVTDFKRAVKAEDGEAIAFGFVEWASKEAFEAGKAAMQADDRMPKPGTEMPFDGLRLIYGGFSVLLDTSQRSDG